MCLNLSPPLVSEVDILDFKVLIHCSCLCLDPVVCWLGHLLGDVSLRVSYTLSRSSVFLVLLWVSE